MITLTNGRKDSPFKYWDIISKKSVGAILSRSIQIDLSKINYVALSWTALPHSIAFRLFINGGDGHESRWDLLAIANTVNARKLEPLFSLQKKQIQGQYVQVTDGFFFFNDSIKINWGKVSKISHLRIKKMIKIAFLDGRKLLIQASERNKEIIKENGVQNDC